MRSQDGSQAPAAQNAPGQRAGGGHLARGAARNLLHHTGESASGGLGYQGSVEPWAEMRRYCGVAVSCVVLSRYIHLVICRFI